MIGAKAIVRVRCRGYLDHVQEIMVQHGLTDFDALLQPTPRDLECWFRLDSPEDSLWKEVDWQVEYLTRDKVLSDSDSILIGERGFAKVVLHGDVFGQVAGDPNALLCISARHREYAEEYLIVYLNQVTEQLSLGTLERLLPTIPTFIRVIDEAGDPIPRACILVARLAGNVKHAEFGYYANDAGELRVGLNSSCVYSLTGSSESNGKVLETTSALDPIIVIPTRNATLVLRESDAPVHPGK